MKPPDGSNNTKYGCVYVDGSILVADMDVASLTAEGWVAVYDEAEPEAEPEPEQKKPSRRKSGKRGK